MTTNNTLLRAYGRQLRRALFIFALTVALHGSLRWPTSRKLQVQLKAYSRRSENEPRSLIDKLFKPCRKVLASALVAGTSLIPAKPASAIGSLVPRLVQSKLLEKTPYHASKPGKRTTSTSTSRRYSDAPSSKNSFVRDAVRAVGPSVVRIDCEREISPLMSLFMENFKDGDTIKVSGSGIVVSPDGYLLTNAHVIQNAKSITITLSNGRSFRSSVIAFDELTDLAVIKADVGEYALPEAPLGDSSRLQSGDWVIAVGCPVGLDFTVTLGICSSPKRSAFEVGATNLKGSYIQTDAALNSGNSGGPLVNADGEVIGINTMVRTNTEAIGFAIPINRARQIYDVLRLGKKPSHAFFGLEVMTLTPDYARIHNEDPNAQRLPEVHGALVVRVAPTSPAATSGFRKNDIIVEVNGDDVGNSDDAEGVLDKCRPGSIARVTVMRGELASSIELNPTPLDLLTVIEERRSKEPLLPGMKPQHPNPVPTPSPAPPQRSPR